MITENTIICIQETWLHPSNPGTDYQLEDKILHLNSVHRGAGVGTYLPQEFRHIKDFTATYYQMSVFASNFQMVVNIYRSKDANSEIFINNLATVIRDWNGEIFLCADWNICGREDRNHSIFKFLTKENFCPAIEPPKGTHRDGRCIDMIWVKNLVLNRYKYSIDFKYYSDHGQISLSQLRSL